MISTVIGGWVGPTAREGGRTIAVLVYHGTITKISTSYFSIVAPSIFDNRVHSLFYVDVI